MRPPDPRGPAGEDPRPFEAWDAPRAPWMLPGGCRSATERTLLLEATTRLLFPVVLTFSLFLLLVGHYEPGGGFTGGLVAGLAFVLRHLAGGGPEAGARGRVRPPVLIGSGLSIALVTGLAPVLVGGDVLSSTKFAADLPLLGHIETQSSLVLDVGVYVLIVGVVLDLLRTLGTGIERDMRAAGERT